MISSTSPTRIVTVDCASVANENDFWNCYVTAANPDGSEIFGRNLDAFWDAVNGGPGWPGVCQLRFINCRSIKGIRDGQFYEALCDIARDSSLVEIQVE